MKSHQIRKSRSALPFALRLAGVTAALGSLLLYTPLMADAFSISGESNTILRMRETTQKRDLFPAYEYLRLSVLDVGGDSSLSLHIGGWGRADLADKTTNDYVDGDLQYGYLSYRGAKNNLVFNAGRQFVNEGVATERLDGFYLRSDLAAGFGAAGFLGSAVVTEPNFQGADMLFGGRLSHSIPKYYSIGISALQANRDGDRLRQEGGFDLWLHPVKQVDVTGRSSYNLMTSGWMEHDYALTYAPLSVLTIGVDLASINYKDYFQHVTTSTLSLTNGILDPKEKSFSMGGSVGYTPLKNLLVSADYKRYTYDIAGNANYFGGKARYSLPENFSTGFSIHRMDGATDKLRYNEYRVFAAKKLGKADLTFDFFDVNYDSSINTIRNTFSITGAAAYEISEQLKVSADIDYGKSPDFNDEVKGFVKLTYAFNTKHAAEGRSKGEK